MELFDDPRAFETILVQVPWRAELRDHVVAPDRPKVEYFAQVSQRVIHLGLERTVFFADLWRLCPRYAAQAAIRQAAQQVLGGGWRPPPHGSWVGPWLLRLVPGLLVVAALFLPAVRSALAGLDVALQYALLDAVVPRLEARHVALVELPAEGPVIPLRSALATTIDRLTASGVRGILVPLLLERPDPADAELVAAIERAEARIPPVPVYLAFGPGDRGLWVAPHNPALQEEGRLGCALVQADLFWGRVLFEHRFLLACDDGERAHPVPHLAVRALTAWTRAEIQWGADDEHRLVVGPITNAFDIGPTGPRFQVRPVADPPWLPWDLPKDAWEAAVSWREVVAVVGLREPTPSRLSWEGFRYDAEVVVTAAETLLQGAAPVEAPAQAVLAGAAAVFGFTGLLSLDLAAAHGRLGGPLARWLRRLPSVLAVVLAKPLHAAIGAIPLGLALGLSAAFAAQGTLVPCLPLVGASVLGGLLGRPSRRRP